MMAAVIRVLYVDDESDLLEISKLFLEESGDFAVTTAISADEGIRLLEQEKFDAIISDYQMPVMNGIQFLVEVRSRFGPIPFILFTGRGREEVVIQAINSGADFYLQKGGEPGAQFAELSHKIKSAASSKRADDLLRKSEEKYRHLIEHANEAIVVVQDGIPKLVNHQTVELTGYSEQELLSLPFSAFIYPDDRAMVMERYQKRMMGEELLTRYAFRLSSKDGSTRWVELSVVVIDWDGRPATLNFLTDITERKLAEEALLKNTDELHASYDKLTATDDELRHTLNALAENEKLYRTLFHEMLNGFAVHEIICDENGTPEDYRFIDANPAFERMTGLNRDDLIGKTVLEILPNTEQIWIERCGRVALTGTSDHFENYSQEFKKFYEVTVYQNAPYQFTTFISDVTDRKRAEDFLRKSEQQFRALSENSQDFIMRYDKEHRHTYANPACLRVSGMTEEQFLGKTHHELGFPPDLCALWEPAIDRVFSTGQPYSETFAWTGAYGEVVLDWQLFPEKDDQGCVVSVLGVSRDITKRKVAEEKLLETMEYLNNLFDYANAPIIVWDPNFVITRFNHAFEDLTLISAQEIIGQRLDILFPKESRDASLLHIKKTLEGERWETVEIPILVKDGSVRTVLWNSANILDTHGRIISTIAQGVDITEGKRAEVALKESEEFLHKIINTLSDPIHVKDRQHRIILINDAACRLFNRSRDEIIGKTAYDLFPRKEMADVSWQKDEEVFTTGKESDNEETNTYAHEKTLTVLVKKTLYTDTAGNKFLVGITTDITDRKRAEELLQKSEERLNLAIEGAHLGLWDLNFVTNEVIHNRQWTEMLGFSSKEMDTPSRWWQERVHPDDYALVSKSSQDHIAEKTPYFDCIYRMKHKNGSWRWVHSQGKVVSRDTNNQPVRMIGINQDITDSKRAEDEIATLTKQIEFILGATKTGIDIIDAEFNIRYIDPAWQKMYGDPSGRKCYDYFMGLKCPCPGCGIPKALETKQPVISEEILTKENNRVVQVTSIPYMNETGEWLVAEINVDISEFKRKEKALIAADQEIRQTKEMFRAFLDHSYDAVFIHDTEGKVLDVNVTTLRLYRVTYEEALRYTIADYSGPANTIEEAHEHWTRALAGEDQFFPWQARRPNDGTVFDVEVYLTSITLDNRQMILGNIRDITERKRAEKELCESEERYSSLFSNNYSVSLLIDPDTGRIVDANAAACRYYGYSEEQLVGMGIYEINRQDKDNVIQNLMRAKNERHFFSTHFLADGKLRNVEVYSGPIIVNGKSLFYSIIHDVTDRVKAEEELKSSRRFIEHTLTTTPALIYIYDIVEGRNVYTNRGIFEALGYTPEEISAMGQDLFSRILHPDDAGAVGQHHARFSTLPDSTVAEIEYRMKHADGSWRWLHSRDVVFQRTADGAVKQILGSSIDITERKMAEEALQEANKKLNLLSSITRHDINNQLLTLNGFLGILHRKVPDPTLEEFFSKMTKASERIAAMIRFTREYESIGVNAPVWQDCRKLVNTAAKQAPLGHVIMKNDLPEGQEVFADPLIMKVFYNLMDNAARYGGKITTIRFSFKERGDDHVVVCEDDGVGVVAEEKEQIFERGFGKNTGLGLSLAREILDITKITIRETGEPGKGARFEITVHKGAWRTASKGA